MRQSPCHNTVTRKDDKMTAKAEAQMTAKEQEKAALKAREAEIVAKETELNAERTGKGTRATIGLTRGRNPQMVQYESFWESLPDTLPKTLSEFMELSKVQDEAAIVSFLIDGFNSAQYAAASDPVAEFQDASWSKEVQTQFRFVIKNYSGATGVSIDDAVTLIKPGFAAGVLKTAVEKVPTKA
jgi:hypothetical protein